MMAEIINEVKVAETIGFIKGKFGKIQMFNTRNVMLSVTIWKIFMLTMTYISTTIAVTTTLRFLD